MILNQILWTHPHDIFDLFLVGRPILPEEIVGIGLGWRIGVWIVKKVLNTEEDLLDGNSGLPAFFLVENAKAHGTRGVHVRMKERRHEFAYKKFVSKGKLRNQYGSKLVHLGGLVGYSVMLQNVSRGVSRKKGVSQLEHVAFWEYHVKLEESSFPYSLLLARDTTAPLHEIKSTLGTFRWLGEEPKRVILTPLLSTAVSARISRWNRGTRDYYPVKERDEPFFLQSIDTERHDESAIAGKSSY